MADKHMQRCLALRGITEEQLKTAVRYHFTSTWIAKVKSNSVCKDVE